MQRRKATAINEPGISWYVLDHRASLDLQQLTQLIYCPTTNPPALGRRGTKLFESCSEVTSAKHKNLETFSDRFT